MTELQRKFLASELAERRYSTVTNDLCQRVVDSSFPSEDMMRRILAARAPINLWAEVGKPLDTAAPETMDGWIACADGRTLWEYANGVVR